MPKFAVDSADVVTEALWNQVVAAAGAPPKVWFRYVSGRYGTSRPEIALLHSKGCDVGLIYDLATPQSVAGDYNAGAADARAAIAAYQALGAPANVCPFIDVETGWQVNPDWICGVADTFRAGPFWKAGGLYCNPDTGNASAFAEPFASAKGTSANVGLMVFWSSEPEVATSRIVTAATLPPWAPATCCEQPVVVWQCKEGAYGGIVDVDMVADDFMGAWAAQAPTVAGFTDVSPSAWYAGAVAKVAELGLMDGVTPTSFQPDGNVTRAQLAVTLARIAAKAGW